jgi:lipid-binding SYLF domain-containing protein
LNLKESVMKKYVLRTAAVALSAMLVSSSLVTPSRAETGRVSVVFTKGGFIVGVGGGQGVLTFRGRHYPFKVSGASIGATIGASTSKLVGTASNLRSPGDIAGTYTAAGAGGALAAGAGGVQLQNANGVILQLSGPKVGVELSASLAGVTITMQ